MNARILGFVRTPFAAQNGAFKDVPPERLGGVVLAAVLARAELARERLSEVALGSVLDAGRGPNPARVLLHEGENELDAYAWTVRAGGASALEALLRSGLNLSSREAAAIVGADSASRAPYLVPEARAGSKLGGVRFLDSAIRDALEGSDEFLPAGVHAAVSARDLGLERDGLAGLRARSVARAKAAPRKDVVAVHVPQGKGGEKDVSDDDLAGERPLTPGDQAFTATLSDGAAALAIAGEDLAKELGRADAPRIVSVARVSGDVTKASTAPVAALKLLLEGAKRTAADLRAVEIDELHTVAPIAARNQLGLAEERVNARGGAHAFGHAGGACGLRALGALLAELEHHGGGLGAIAYGAGMGAAIALLVER